MYSVSVPTSNSPVFKPRTSPRCIALAVRAPLNWIDNDLLHAQEFVYLRHRAGELMSFLGIDGLHVFVTGAAGGIATAAVKEFLGTNLL